MLVVFVSLKFQNYVLGRLGKPVEAFYFLTRRQSLVALSISPTYILPLFFSRLCCAVAFSCQRQKFAVFQVPGGPLLNEILKFSDHGWEAPLKYPKDLEEKVCKDGLLLSGPEVVSSDERRMQLTKRYRQAIVVEMEDDGKISVNNDENCEVHAEFLQSTVMSLALHSLAPREYYYWAGQNSPL